MNLDNDQSEMQQANAIVLIDACPINSICFWINKHMKHKKIPADAQPTCADVLQHFALVNIIKRLQMLQFNLAIDTLLEIIEDVHQNILNWRQA